MKFKLLSLLVFIILLGCNKHRESSKTHHKNIMIDVSFVRDYPHDTTSFTEGLLFYKGELYESTGAAHDLPQTRSLFGTVDLETGIIEPKAELNRNQFFGEGISFIDNRLFQLTYTSRIGFIYDDSTFNKIQEFSIPSQQGWGLTSNGQQLIMSDGTNNLTYLNPETQQVVKTVSVFDEGHSLDQLNELEYIRGYIYANVWHTNIIVKIDPKSGSVVGKIDLTPFADEAKAIFPNAMEMNGIAFEEKSKSIFITGKMWPKIYQLKIKL